MIQRIQTLYMLIVTALMAVTLFAPLAWFAGEAGEFGLYAFSLKTAAGEAVQPTVYMGVVLALACVLPFITIFLFKRRLLQLRLCVVEMVLLVGSAVSQLPGVCGTDVPYAGAETCRRAAAGLPAFRIPRRTCGFPRRTDGARGRPHPLIPKDY